MLLVWAFHSRSRLQSAAAASRSAPACISSSAYQLPSRVNSLSLSLVQKPPVTSITVVQSRLNSNIQRRSNTWTRKVDCMILRRAVKDTRDHSAKEMAGKKRVARWELHDFHERSDA